MGSNARINKILQDHERRISALESFLTKSKLPKITKGKRSLPNRVMELRNKGFFSQPKTAEELHKEIQKNYPCELSRVEVALIRLFQKKQLRKASKTISRKKYNAYVW